MEWIIFGLVVGLCLLLGVAISLPEAPNARGVAHDTFPTLQQGGDGLARSARILWLGWVIGLLEIALFAALMSLGVRTGQRRRQLLRALSFAAVAYALTWTALLLAYGRFAAEPTGGTVLLFPLPTTILFYGMWFVPMLFVVVFIRGFDRWVVTAEDESIFERLVAERRSRGD